MTKKKTKSIETGGHDEGEIGRYKAVDYVQDHANLGYGGWRGRGVCLQSTGREGKMECLGRV